MIDRYSLSNKEILRKIKYLQEQDEKKQNNYLLYAKAKAFLNKEKEITFNGKNYSVDINTPEEANAIIKNAESEESVTEINNISEKKKLSKKQKKIASVAPPEDEITAADFKSLRNKNIDEFVENLYERKKRKKKYTAKNIPNNYKSKVSKKARSSMAREMNKCAKTPRPKSCYDYWDADKKHDKALSESLDLFVEMLDERKKRKKKKSASKKLSAKTRKALKKKAEKANMPLGALTSVYRKGLGAWLTGHRPGTPQHAWAMARVNSFIRGGKTRSVDKAEWKKVQKHRK